MQTEKMITDTKRISEMWKEHYEQLLSTETTPSLLPAAHTLPQAFNQVEPEASTKSEIRDAIEGLRTHRAGECDGITPELYNSGGETLVDQRELLLDSLSNTEQIPANGGYQSSWHSTRKATHKFAQAIAGYRFSA